MKRTKYPINREFLPLSLYTPTISRESIARANKLYRPPKSIFRDPAVSIRTVMIPGCQGGEIELKLITPDWRGISITVFSQYSRRRLCV